MPDSDRFTSRLPDLDEGRFPAIPPADAEAIFSDILAGEREAIVSLVDAVQDVDDGSDWKARFLLHGLATHVAAPERETGRAMVQRVYLAEAASSERSIPVRVFLVRQLELIAGPDAAPALGNVLANADDPQLASAAGAALAAIGEPARPALTDARGKAASDAARTAIDHALLQIERR